MFFLAHPTSNNNVKALANKLVERNLLNGFFTTVAIFPNSFLDKISRIYGLTIIKRRLFIEELRPFSYIFPFFEVGRILASKLNLQFLLRPEDGFFSVDSIYKKFDKWVSLKLNRRISRVIKTNIVYSYEDGALFTFQKARALGMVCCYDLPIAYWEKSLELLEEEAKRLPLWASTLDAIKDSKVKLERKTSELQLADIVVVPSKFVLESLPIWAKSKRVIMVPFGSPFFNKNIDWELKNRKIKSRPLKVLFVGLMTQRKGLADLFEAFKILDRSDIELVVMGSLQHTLDFYISEFPKFTYEPNRSNTEVLQLMSNCDIFCLPSIIEGRALVMQEAMSQGLPIIITPNTGGEDLVIEGKTGFLVPIRSPEIIAERLLWFLNNKDKIVEMGKFAQHHASNYTWDNYSNGIIDAIIESKNS